MGEPEDIVARAHRLFREIKANVAETNAKVQELEALIPELQWRLEE